MASRPSNSTAIALLRLIRDASAQQRALSVAEMMLELRELDSTFLKDYLNHSAGYSHNAERLNRLLAELKDLGLVGSSSIHPDTGMQLWTVGENWHPARADGGDSGGDNRPPRPPGNDGGDPDGGDGGGIREVLSHPLLFSLDQTDFDQVVDTLFSAEQE